jgi:hypothetical protein
MDKKLFKAYVRTLVEDEVKKILPEMLAEAVSEIKKLQLSESTVTTQPQQKPQLDRARLAELMGIDYDGETLHARGSSSTTFVNPAAAPPEITSKINRDYSQLMKKMGLT